MEHLTLQGSECVAQREAEKHSESSSGFFPLSATEIKSSLRRQSRRCSGRSLPTEELTVMLMLLAVA